MKKIFAVLFALLISVTLIGASEGGAEGFIVKGENGPAVALESGTAPAEIVIVYPDVSDHAVSVYAPVFAERLSAILGVEVGACTESEFSSVSTLSLPIFIGEEYDNHVFVEKLIAENEGMLTFNPKSEEEWDLYCGNVSYYSLYADAEGIHINASESWALYWAIDNFLNDVESSETYVLEVGAKLLPPEGYVFPDPTVFIGKGMNPYFAVTKEIQRMPAEIGYDKLPDNMQGGGTDGEFAYIALDGDDIYGNLLKYSLPHWEVVDVSDSIVFHHGNDVSYMAEEDLLILAHCTDEAIRSFSYVNPHTLEVEGFGNIPVNCWGLEYDNKTERFIVEADWINYIFDKDFNLISEMPYGDADGTPQSLFVEGDYIFDVRWDMGWLRNSGIPFKDCDFQNYIMIHSYDQVYVERAYIPVVQGEPEFIFRHENLYYIGILGNVVDGESIEVGVVYEFVLLPEVLW